MTERQPEFVVLLIAEREALLAQRADLDVKLRALTAALSHYIDIPKGPRPKRPMSAHHRAAVSAGKRAYHARLGATALDAPPETAPHIRQPSTGDRETP